MEHNIIAVLKRNCQGDRNHQGEQKHRSRVGLRRSQNVTVNARRRQVVFFPFGSKISKRKGNVSTMGGAGL